MQATTQSAILIAPTRHQTTSFLTTTTLIYAIGAGITAAAGTRLALQSILEKCFERFSFQSILESLPPHGTSTTRIQFRAQGSVSKSHTAQAQHGDNSFHRGPIQQSHTTQPQRRYN